MSQAEQANNSSNREVVLTVDRLNYDVEEAMGTKEEGNQGRKKQGRRQYIRPSAVQKMWKER